MVVFLPQVGQEVVRHERFLLCIAGVAAAAFIRCGLSTTFRLRDEVIDSGDDVVIEFASAITAMIVVQIVPFLKRLKAVA